MKPINVVLDLLSLKVSAENYSMNPPATFDMIASFESRTGFRIPDDMRAFYLRFNGGYLFRDYEQTGCFRSARGDYFGAALVPLHEIRSARQVLRGKESDEYGPDNWMVFYDNGDFDVLAIELNQSTSISRPIRDCDPESISDSEDCSVVYRSFTEFINALMHQKEATLFWL